MKIPDLIIYKVDLDKDGNEISNPFMTVGKYLLFICILVNTGINLTPLKA
jgi:hypothetical protein